MIVNLVGDRLRKLAGNSWLPGPHDFKAADGGTGSGLACLMLDRLSVDSGKSPVVFSLCGLARSSDRSGRAYNTALGALSGGPHRRDHRDEQ